MKPFFLFSLILMPPSIFNGNPQEPQINLSGLETNSLMAQRLAGKYLALEDGRVPEGPDREINEFTLERAQEDKKALIFQMVRTAGLDARKICVHKLYSEDDPEDMKTIYYIVLKSKANGQPYILTESVYSQGSYMRFCHIEFQSDTHISFYRVHPKGLEELLGEFAKMR